MNLKDHPLIQDLAKTDPAILKFLSPVEIAVIEVCQQIVEDVVA